MTAEHGPVSRRRPVWPAPGSLTKNEHAWVAFLRCMWPEGTPPPSLDLLQAVRLACLHPDHLRSWAADPASRKHSAYPEAAKGSVGE